MEELQQNARFPSKTFQKQKSYQSNKNQPFKSQAMKSSSQVPIFAFIHSQKQSDSNIMKYSIISGQSKNKLQLPQLLQSCKQYVNYFKRFNLSDVLLKLDITFTSKYYIEQDQITQNQYIQTTQGNQMKNQVQEVQNMTKTRKIKQTLILNNSKRI